jgi:hydroxypyruvate reductase
MKLRDDATYIINQSIQAVLPDKAVTNALRKMELAGSCHIIAIGKAAWRMTKAAVDCLGEQFKGGVAVTKYDHSLGDIEGMTIFEAGHPVPDQASIDATDAILRYVSGIPENETILLLISGGGSALFEKTRHEISLAELEDINKQLLASGANIVEINTIRKHLSEVKGGQFAQLCAPRQIQAIILSDVLGDRLDTIASGPAHPDSSTSAEAQKIVEKYNLKLSEKAQAALLRETPKSLDNVNNTMIGSVDILCREAMEHAQARGYHTTLMSTAIEEEASTVGERLGQLAKRIVSGQEAAQLPCAIIAGGEPVVTLKGNGLGGRNQELALSAAFQISGLPQVVIASVGSDGTDGPTDAAGGLVDGASLERMRQSYADVEGLLANNDSNRALADSGDLIITGPTGTNVNDLIILLIDKESA